MEESKKFARQDAASDDAALDDTTTENRYQTMEKLIDNADGYLS